MRSETLRDVLDWTETFHRHMTSRLVECAERHSDERSRLLLRYLADHEKSLSETVDRFRKESDKKALDTWCYDHIDQSAIVHRDLCDTDFSVLDPDGIMQRVSEEHDEVVDLYRYLSERAEIPEAEELMTEVREMEEHQIMLMMQAANRLHDV